MPKVKFQPKLIWLSIFLFCLTRFFIWVHVNPMFQGPDEVQHLAMIAQIDRNNFQHYHDHNAVTWQDFENSFDYQQDFYQQKNVVARYGNRPHYEKHGVWGIAELEKIHRPRFDDTPGHDTYRHNTYSYPPVYYAVIAYGLKFYRSIFDGKLVEYHFLSRLFGFIFYWIFVSTVLIIARNVLGQGERVIASILILGLPSLVFLTTVSNNDNGLLAFTSLLALCMVKILKTNDRYWFVLGAIASLLLCFTKSNGIVSSCLLIGLTALGLWFQAERKKFFATSALLSIPFLSQFLSAQLFGKLQLAGSPTNLSFLQYTKSFFDLFFKYMLFNTFGQFAWFEVNFHIAIYRVFQFFFFAAIGTTVVVLGKSLRPKVKLVKFSPRVPLFAIDEIDQLCILILFSSFVMFWAVLFGYQWVVLKDVGFVMQGRYALALFPFLIIAVVWSARSLRHSSKILRGLEGLSYFWLICSYAALGMIVKRFYWGDSGETAFQVYEHSLQYKPEYFKSPWIHFGAISFHLLMAVILARVAIRRLRESQSDVS